MIVGGGFPASSGVGGPDLRGVVYCEWASVSVVTLVSRFRVGLFPLLSDRFGLCGARFPDCTIVL